VTFLSELERELRGRRVPAKLRRRIIVELDDHLRCDPTSTARLGAPSELARQFADELATAESRRSGFVAFAVLVPAGIGFGVCWLTVSVAGGWPDIFAAETVPLGLLAAISMLIAPQVALAAGLLAVLGCMRTRREAIVPTAEGALLRRRAVIALAAGGAALGALGLYAIEYRSELASWWVASTLALAGVLVLPLAAAAVLARRAAAIRSSVPGRAGDVFDDLPVRLPRRPWALCAGVALLAAVVVGVAGGPDEGSRNAVMEALAVLSGFVVLGRPLGLRK
jgi:hypothetical protein